MTTSQLGHEVDRADCDAPMTLTKARRLGATLAEAADELERWELVHFERESRS
jgi:hypothetical protein